MRICTTGAVLLIAATVPALAHAQGTVSFDAELAKTATTPHAGFKAGGVEWSCTTTRCTGKGSGKDPLGTCKAIVPQVGALKSFTAAGRAVDLHACGAVPAATTMTAAPMSRTAPVSTVKPATGAAAARRGDDSAPRARGGPLEERLGAGRRTRVDDVRDHAHRHGRARHTCAVHAARLDG